MMRVRVMERAREIMRVVKDEGNEDEVREGEGEGEAEREAEGEAEVMMPIRHLAPAPPY